MMNVLLKILDFLRGQSVGVRVAAIAAAAIAAAVLLFSSCSGYRSVSLNVDKPEKVTFNMSDSIGAHVR